MLELGADIPFAPMLSLAVSLKTTTPRPLSVGPGLDFSGLPNLPESARSGVTSAAAATAAEIGGGTTAQDVIDRLAQLDRIWLSPELSTYTDVAGTTLATTGDPVASWRDWASNTLITQNNVANRPTLTASGLLFEASKFVSQSVGGVAASGQNREIAAKYTINSSFPSTGNPHNIFCVTTRSATEGWVLRRRHPADSDVDYYHTGIAGLRIIVAAPVAGVTEIVSARYDNPDASTIFGTADFSLANFTSNETFSTSLYLGYESNVHIGMYSLPRGVLIGPPGSTNDNVLAVFLDNYNA